MPMECASGGTFEDSKCIFQILDSAMIAHECIDSRKGSNPPAWFANLILRRLVIWVSGVFYFI